MAPNRWFAAPEVPTADEQGLRGTYGSYWHGFWAPKNTPKAIIARLNAAAMKAMADPAAQKRIAVEGMEIPPPNGKPRKCSAPSRRPRSRNGGRSSRPPELSRNNRFLRRAIDRRRALFARESPRCHCERREAIHSLRRRPGLLRGARNDRGRPRLYSEERLRGMMVCAGEIAALRPHCITGRARSAPVLWSRQSPASGSCSAPPVRRRP